MTGRLNEQVSEKRARARRAIGRRRPRLRLPTRYEVKFNPPDVFLSKDEFLVPLVHTNRRELRTLAQALNGSSYWVKVVDAEPQSIPMGHMVMAKLKALTSHGGQPEQPTFKAEGKVRGRILGEVEGIEVTANLQRAKRAGKDRIWIQIRQRGAKRWRVSEALSYARAVDVQFEKSE